MKHINLISVMFTAVIATAACAPIEGEATEVATTEADQPEITAANAAIPLELERRAADLVASVAGTKMAPNWKDAKLSGRVTALYRPDLEEVAYYEVEVSPSGFVVVSAGEHDHPIVHWSSSTTPPSRLLQDKARIAGDVAVKFFRLDALSYAAEDDAGRLVAKLGNLPGQMDVQGIDLAYGVQFDSTWEPEADEGGKVTGGELITRALRSEGDAVVGHVRFAGEERETLETFRPSVTLRPFDSWQELKIQYGLSFQDRIEALRASAKPSWGRSDAAQPDESQMTVKSGSFGWNYVESDGGPAAQRAYQQYPPGWSPEWCYSGCGATAWAMLFGWADYVAHNNPAGDNKWANHTGIFRAGGGYGDPSVVAPNEWWDTGVYNMTLQIEANISTWCSGDQGATAPWSMNGAVNYLYGRANLGVYTSYNALTMGNAGNTQDAINTIAYERSPAIIGTGDMFVAHYRLAYGYAWRWLPTGGEGIFHVNNGWGYGANMGHDSDGDNVGDGDWISANVWFAGKLVYRP